MIEQAEFGWTDSDPTSAHSYLLPAVSESLRKLYGNKSVRILDLGCGNGYVTAYLAKNGYEVIGIEGSSDGVAMARAQHPGLVVRQASVYDAEWPGVEAESVDCVLSLEVVEHLFLPKKLFRNSYPVIKGDGHLIVSTPYHGYWKNLALSLFDGWDRHFDVQWDGGHIKFFSKNTLRRMAEEAGFRNIRFVGVGRFPFLWKSMILIAEK